MKSNKTEYLRVNETDVILVEIQSLDTKYKKLPDRYVQEIFELLREKITSRIAQFQKKNPLPKHKDSSGILTGSSIRIGYSFKSRPGHQTCVYSSNNIPSATSTNDEDQRCLKVAPEKLVVYVQLLSSGSPKGMSQLLRRLSDVKHTAGPGVSISSYFQKTTSSQRSQGQGSEVKGQAGSSTQGQTSAQDDVNDAEGPIDSDPSRFEDAPPSEGRRNKIKSILKRFHYPGKKKKRSKTTHTETTAELYDQDSCDSIKSDTPDTVLSLKSDTDNVDVMEDPELNNIGTIEPSEIMDKKITEETNENTGEEIGAQGRTDLLADGSKVSDTDTIDSDILLLDINSHSVTVEDLNQSHTFTVSKVSVPTISGELNEHVELPNNVVKISNLSDVGQRMAEEDKNVRKLDDEEQNVIDVIEEDRLSDSSLCAERQANEKLRKTKAVNDKLHKVNRKLDEIKHANKMLNEDRQAENKVNKNELSNVELTNDEEETVKSPADYNSNIETPPGFSDKQTDSSSDTSSLPSASFCHVKSNKRFSQIYGDALRDILNKVENTKDSTCSEPGSPVFTRKTRNSMKNEDLENVQTEQSENIGEDFNDKSVKPLYRRRPRRFKRKLPKFSDSDSEDSLPDRKRQNTEKEKASCGEILKTSMSQRSNFANVTNKKNDLKKFRISKDFFSESKPKTQPKLSFFTKNTQNALQQQMADAVNADEVMDDNFDNVAVGPDADFPDLDTELIEQLSDMPRIKSEADLDLLREVKSLSCVEDLNEDHIRFLLRRNETLVRQIFEGKVKCTRHEAYKVGGSTRRNLLYASRLGPYSDEQIDVVMNYLISVFCKKHHKYFDYVMKVLLPELLIQFHMEIHDTTHDESDKMLGPRTPPPLPTL